MINQTGQSALDFFSIGHFVTGSVMFLLIFYIVYFYYKKEFSYSFIVFISFTLTIILSVWWEILENSDLYLILGLKYNDTKDSLVNTYTDIMLNIFGATTVLVIFWYFNVKNIIKKKKRK